MRYLRLMALMVVLMIGLAQPFAAPSADAQSFQEGPDFVYDYLPINGNSVRVDWNLFGGAESIPYQVNQQLIDDGFLPAITAALETWADAPGSAVSFNYLGATSATSEIQFNPASGTYPAPSDGANVISYGLLGPGVAGRAGISGSFGVDEVTGEVVPAPGNGNFDMTLDLNTVTGGGSSAQALDMESLVLHEMGHALGLGHPTQLQTSVMWHELAIGTNKRTLDTVDVFALAMLYPDPTEPTEPTPFDPQEPGHSIAVNSSGQAAMTLLKEDGSLYVRRRSSNGSLGGWNRLGAGSWASADVAIDDAGRVEIVAVKNSGALFTRSWLQSGAFGSWKGHGASTWAVDTQPSISTSGQRITLAAVKNDGRLYTRERGASSAWGSFTLHGRSDWAHVDVAMAADGDTWFAGTKADGRLYVRKRIGGTWSGFSLQGKATWSTTTPPAVSARATGVVVAAVKADGRLFSREQSNGVWGGFVKHGLANWASVDVDTDEAGTLALAGVKRSGQLYTRTGVGSWGPFEAHGRATWSAGADPGIAVQGSRVLYVAAKSDGAAWLRVRSSSSWGGFAQLGRPSWAN